jgi:hypothetical protein
VAAKWLTPSQKILSAKLCWKSSRLDILEWIKITSPNHVTPQVIKCELSIVVRCSVPELKFVVDLLVFSQVLLVLTHTNQHSTFFNCQFGMSHFTWHVAGLELRKDIAQHTGEEFLETVSPDAANFLKCVQNCTIFDKQ